MYILNFCYFTVGATSYPVLQPAELTVLVTDVPVCVDAVHLF